MENDQLFLVPVLQEKHARKRGMPTAKSKLIPAMNTADLTQAIIKFLKFRGHYAVRINCFGIYDEKEKKWRKSSTERGTADIHACLFGKHLSVEIKSGSDRMRPHQYKVKEAVTDAGGIYLVISDFMEFHLWYKAFMQ
ncbi:hypothetical protein [Fibrella forsythiae]|uniref:VRR-NUC domain-containing protein n=1 Tax=Fibrella forsythiae TaxID=2817061 RepID=A0ABS3JLH8_9BACT|nr:hypothetical protein [Fibrella forsythiae]MBO0950858.1 hypothetical protein [Fibrella forsythiae]